RRLRPRAFKSTDARHHFLAVSRSAAGIRHAPIMSELPSKAAAATAGVQRRCHTYASCGNSRRVGFGVNTNFVSSSIARSKDKSINRFAGIGLIVGTKAFRIQ